jgi:CheY-like chemotaxis protein
MSRILIAEDEEHIAKLVLFKLEKAGHSCQWAPDGRAALEALKSQGPFDLIVLDIMMPHVDGWSVLKQVSELGIVPAPRVIMLSARGFKQDLGVAAQVKARHYLKKPFRPSELVELVSKVLAEEEA